MDKGSRIKINYVERVKTTSRVTETNVESAAKEAVIFDSDNPSRYTPSPTVVGSGRPVKGVDEAGDAKCQVQTSLAGVKRTYSNTEVLIWN